MASKTRTRKAEGKRSNRLETAALSLGGNLGDAEGQLERAIAALRPAFAALRRAPLYRTAPISSIAQPDYLNTALVGSTRWSPEELLGLAKALEHAAGRRRGPRLGPRPLDIDLLLYGDLVRTTPELTLPHPRLAERRFYLEPLARIAPELRVPPHGRTVAELLRSGVATGEIREVGWSAERGVG